MSTFSGYCKLEINGRCFEGCNVSLETGRQRQAVGFLSAPLKLLNQARAATTTRLRFADGRATAISILHVSRTGIALIVAKPPAQVSVRLSRGSWSQMIERDDARAACISAEHALHRAKGSGLPLEITVWGGPRGAARKVRHYLSALHDEMVAEQQLPAGRFELHACLARPNKRPAAMLEGLDCRIRAVQLLIEKQSTTIAELRIEGASVELAQNVLRTMKETLRLLVRHRHLARQGTFA